jgi:3',5'-cyclic-AMP phosphodiesterase
MTASSPHPPQRKAATPVPDQTGRKVIIQLSDTHVTSGANLHGDVDSLANLAAILASVEQSGTRPDLLLFTGDLADKGEPEAYRRFRATVEPYARRMGAPVLLVIGNHDEREAFRTHLLDGGPPGETIDQVLDIGGLRVIALDSTVPGRPHGELRDEQLEWLAAELAAPAAHGTVIALHHPPIGGPAEFGGIVTLHGAGRLADVVKGTDTLMIVAGHTHHASAGALAGIPVWVATATAYQMDVLAAGADVLQGKRGSAFTRIDIAGGAAVATHIPVLDGSPLYSISWEKLQRVIAQGASEEEIEAAVSPAGGR